MDSKQIEFLKALCGAGTPSGAELPGQRIVADYVRPYADRMRLDCMGNFEAVLNPNAAYRVLLDGHNDEIGLLVQYIDSKGFIFFSCVGGVNRQLLPGERVKLFGPKGEVNGVIGRKPIHLMDAAERDAGVKKLSDLWIDIGAASKEQAEEYAPLGTYAVIDSGWRELLDDRVSARAFDDRCGVFVVMEALRRLHGKKLNVACHFLSSTQEEVGLLGARTAAFEIDPHLGVSVDVTFASDDPQGCPKEQSDITVGGGPILAVGPSFDPKFLSYLKNTAKDSEIPIQLQPRARPGGTNAYAIRHNRCGVPVAQLSIPLRYMHSAVEVISLTDLDRSAQLLADALAALPENPEFGFSF